MRGCAKPGRSRETSPGAAPPRTTRPSSRGLSAAGTRVAAAWVAAASAARARTSTRPPPLQRGLRVRLQRRGHVAPLRVHGGGPEKEGSCGVVDRPPPAGGRLEEGVEEG